MIRTDEGQDVGTRGLQLPAGTRLAVNIGVDFDAHSAWMGGGRTSPGYLSRGEFDVEVGLPRVLEALGERSIRGNFFTPGHTMVTFPDAFETVLAAGHEISAHGCWHEPLPELEPDEERRLMEAQLQQHERIVGKKPRGYRSPAWDFTQSTLQILEEFGFDWDSSLMGRDLQPYRPRPVTVGYEDGNTFGPESSVLEFPVSWSVDDWPATEHIPGFSAGMQDPAVILSRWMTHVDFALERMTNAFLSVTVHPQAIGRVHNFVMFEQFLDRLLERDGLMLTTLSDLHAHWRD